MKFRLLTIGMFTLLLAGAVYIFSTALSEQHRELPKATFSTEASPSIPVEKGVFTRSKNALAYQDMPDSKRSLATYYDNRAYVGAPPMIPHALLSEKGIGGKACLQCHQNGGYVEQFKTFAPVTPHPEFINCKQCHLPKKTESLFKQTNWKKLTPPTIHRAALEGAPPMIPHALQMRENCLSCHAGPGAAKEIRVTHPERINCRQCHLPQNKKDLFVKPKENTSFKHTSAVEQNTLKESEVAQLSAWISKKNNKNSQHE